jgi:penicillin-binding protein 1C
VFATTLLPLVLMAYVFLAPFTPIEDQMTLPGAVVLASDGEVIWHDGADGLRIPVELGEVSPIMIEATIAAEDGRFWRHPGVDPLAVARAGREYRSNPSGASTITQQLARRLYLEDSDSPLVVRKAREALIALQIEAHYSKDEILSAYLNSVFYGRGAYGVEAAARVYFGVSAAQLDLAQAAFLTGLPQLPATYGSDLGAARERQQYVLDRLVERGVVLAPEAERAASASLVLLDGENPAVAQHSVGYVFDELVRLLPDEERYDGLVVTTTLDRALQSEAERVVRLRLAELEEHDAGNAAVVAIDPESGRMLAMVGGADFDASDGGQINMAVHPRQPGSALKPFLYAAAFEQGFTPATMLLDVPVTFETRSGLYTPVNYDQNFRGPTPVRVALASSLNVPAVRTLDAIGVETFLEMAHRVGLTTLDATEAYGLAITLGSGEVTLRDLTGAYGAIANGGTLHEPYLIERVTDSSRRVLYEHQPSEPVRVLSETHAFLVTDILSDPVARAAGFGEFSVLDNPFGAAVKTGTSSDFRDNWTLGFTPDVVVGVWVGNTDDSPMKNISGVAGAAPIWRDVIEAALERGTRGEFVRPPGLVQLVVCSPTGLLPGPHCPSPALEWFVADAEPTETERYYYLDESGRRVIDPPVEARAWAADAGLRVAASVEAAPRSVYIVQPAPGSVFYLAPELKEQQLLLRAAVPPGATRVEFLVDGLSVGDGTGDDPSLVWQLETGVHELAVVAHLSDGSTASVAVDYEVREP